MIRTFLLALIASLTFAAPAVLADTFVLIVKSATIAPGKSCGCPWDFPLLGTKALPDVYVKAWVYDKSDAQSDYGETWVEWDTLNPEWNKDLVRVKVGQRVTIEVWDKDAKYDDQIGRRSFTLTEKMIDVSAFSYGFEQVHNIRFETRADAKSSAGRVRLMQPYPGPYSVNELTRSKRRDRAVVLLHGLDLRDDGSSPAKPRFVDWQGSTSSIVGALSKHADVFSICYAQSTAVEEIASFPELRNAIGKVKKLGYKEVVLVGHSAGGVLARHFVEEHPGAGVTRVIQIAAPNSGANLASWAVKLVQVPKAQAPFVQSLSPGHRETVLVNRQHKTIPTSIEFVSVCAGTGSKGDGAVNRGCQWPDDLQSQGIPCVTVQGAHMEVMADDACLDVYCKLICEPQPRWSASRVQQARAMR